MCRTVMLLGLILSLAMPAIPRAMASEVAVNRAGYTLQAEEQGDGPVTVVFESGFGQGAGVWKDVIAALGPRYRCVAYARAGLGDSGTDGRPKTIADHLLDLGAVMDVVEPGGKVLLVGHSYGGLLATEFARLHPDRVLGLVLVDPATLAQRREAMQVDRERVLADDRKLLGMLPPRLAADYQALIAQLDGEATSMPRSQSDLPVVLLTSTNVAAEPFVFEETAQGKALWRRQHAALFSGYTRGLHEYVATGHNIHRENPAAVADAIRFIAGTVSSGR